MNVMTTAPNWRLFSFFVYHSRTEFLYDLTYIPGGFFFCIDGLANRQAYAFHFPFSTGFPLFICVPELRHTPNSLRRTFHPLRAVMYHIPAMTDHLWMLDVFNLFY